MITEDFIRKLTEEAVAQLGTKATPANIQAVVDRAVQNLDRTRGTVVSSNSGRIMLTAYGYNSPGVLAAITKILADHNCDVLDMTQKLLQEFFTLMMLVDITNSPADFSKIQNDLGALSERMKLRILVQHEDVFNAMHRI